MKINGEQVKQIEEINKRIKKMNFMCAGIDKDKVERFCDVLDYSEYSPYFASQQISISSIPLINVKNDEYIVPIEKKVITILEMAQYYNIEEMYLYGILKKCNFDTGNSVFTETVLLLEDYKQRCSCEAKVFGLIESRFVDKYSNKPKKAYLDEIASSVRIPFYQLYESYLKCGDVDEAIQQIRDNNLQREMIDQFHQVIDMTVLLDASEYKKYFSYLQDKINIRSRLLDLDINAEGIYLPIEDFYKLMLNNPRQQSFFYLVFDADERELFNLILKTHKEGMVFLTGKHVWSILKILSEKRATVYENTKNFLELLSLEKENLNQSGGIDVSLDAQITNADGISVTEISGFKMK